jgi:toxin CptA
MKPPPVLHLALRRSRLALAIVASTHALTAALFLWLPLTPVHRAAALALTVASAGVALHRHLGPASPSAIRVGIDRRIGVCARSGRDCTGHILDDSYVGARLATIVWRPEGAWRARTLLVLPDALTAEDFRRLRVMLRYGREPPAAGSRDEDAG